MNRAQEIIKSIFDPVEVLVDESFTQVDGYPNGIICQTFGENSFGFCQLAICRVVNGRIEDDHVQYVHVDSLEAYLRAYIA